VTQTRLISIPFFLRIEGKLSAELWGWLYPLGPPCYSSTGWEH